MNTGIKFILADNQDITRAGLRGFISDLFGKCELVDVRNKKELISALMGVDESVVILDYTLFDLNGVDELLIIEKRFRQSNWLLFCNELSEEIIRRLSAEIKISMVLKESSGEEISSALKCTAAGERFLCHEITNLLLVNHKEPEFNPALTPTEIDILRLIAHGKSVKEIAAERVSSIHTVITHKKNIFRKLGVNSVYEATKYTLRAGLVEMMEYYI